ncbi:head fiber protein [Enterobacter ludwigii]|uniref:head fiber protein n=1 Tax=Enterobacter ludwigii TaxID=299767 RepID=UPI003974C0E6
MWRIPSEISKHPAGNSKMTQRVVAQNGSTTTVPSASDVPVAATTTTAGIVKKMTAQADSTATDVAGLLADFNALLAKARSAGLM